MAEKRENIKLQNNMKMNIKIITNHFSPNRLQKNKKLKPLFLMISIDVGKCMLSNTDDGGKNCYEFFRNKSLNNY